MQNRAKDAVEKIENYDKMQQELAQAYKVMKISIWSQNSSLEMKEGKHLCDNDDKWMNAIIASDGILSMISELTSSMRPIWQKQYDK